ncbi:hypothetical protein ACMD2_27199 [Ananas comosus]|uniref:Uncharacterized protein n=1 Tax=Ananas comosus TaxID=4615 RepID=A0A199V2W7_ANACO|nr:hypothetical protein ACMD2_27222 [Ananas comosus]OAY77783.1 hypothetical protein ACMD2_27199 [Ananas comosus]
MGNCFSSGSNNYHADAEREPRYTSNKVRPSDEDRGGYVGEHDVDQKAANFIENFYKNRHMELEKQTVSFDELKDL